MADDDSASREILEGFLEGAERVHIEIVGRFIEEKDIGPLLQHLREMHAIPLAAGEVSDLLLLVAAGKIKSRHIGT